MACQNICRLCNRLIISNSVTFNATENELVVNIPDGIYYNGEKYCIIIAQAIPTTTTINAHVVITIGDGTTTYPLLKSNCLPATACNVRTRTKYSTVVVTNNLSGAFRLLGNIGCCGAEVLASLPVVEETPTPTVELTSLVAKTTTKSTKKEVTTNE